MACNCKIHFLASLIITTVFLPSPTLSVSIPSNSPKETISAAPAVLPVPPLSSPYTEVSPEIAPLLPSPGGSARLPNGSSVPTIPSTPSPPNPDTETTIGPDTAVAPSGMLQESSAVCHVLVKGLRVEAFSGLLACGLVMFLMV